MISIRNSVKICALSAILVFIFTTAHIVSFLEATVIPSSPPISKSIKIQTNPHSDVFSSENKTLARAPPKLLQEYLSNCHGDDTEAITLQRWMGRSGNRIEQLVTAFAFAIIAGRPYIVTTPWNDTVFDVPRQIAVQPPSSLTSLKPTGSCEFRGNTRDCTFVFQQRCATTVPDRRDIYLRNVAPLVRPEVYDSCDPADQETLVIHLRDGDASADVASSHAQPPCDYYHRIIETGNHGHTFNKLILVHSGQLPENLCVESIRSRHQGKLIDSDQPTSIEHDACVFLRAKNIALTSSAFGISFGMMNAHVDKIFFVDAVTSILDPKQPRLHPDAWNGLALPRKVDDFQLDANGLCSTFPRAMLYRVPPDGTIIDVVNKAMQSNTAARKKRVGLHRAVEMKEFKHEYFFNYDQYAEFTVTNCSASVAKRSA